MWRNAGGTSAFSTRSGLMGLLVWECSSSFESRGWKGCGLTGSLVGSHGSKMTGRRAELTGDGGKPRVRDRRIPCSSGGYVGASSFTDAIQSSQGW